MGGVDSKVGVAADGDRYAFQNITGKLTLNFQTKRSHPKELRQFI